MKWMLTALCAVTLTACSHGPTRTTALKDAQTTKQPGSDADPVVARFKGGEVRQSEVDEAAKADIDKLKTDLEKQLIAVRTETAERMIVELLLEKRMADLKLDREQLLEQEVLLSLIHI